jgi:hypothetical protein
MNKIDFYQITDGQTGAQVASGLDDNFNAIEAALNEVEAGAQLKTLFKWTLIVALLIVKKIIIRFSPNLI